jgi:CLIP-associating protein 1/2
VPEEGDTDSEDDRSMNLMSFSAAFEKFPPHATKPQTPKSIGSKPTASVSNALSSGSLSSDVTFGGQQPVVVEDALRARAEQAESAAERLLELVDENDLQEPLAPVPFANPKPKPPPAVGPATNGNNSNGGTVRVKTKPAPIPIVSRAGVPPVTPNARASAVMRQAAMFKDSPAHGRGATSLLDVLQAQRHETGWWLKRTACKFDVVCEIYSLSHLFRFPSSVLAKATPLRSQNDPEAIDELKQHIEALENGTITKESLQRIALICLENGVDPSAPPSPGTSPGSPSPFVANGLPGDSSASSALWDTDRTFARLFAGLMKFLEPTKVRAQVFDSPGGEPVADVFGFLVGG